MMNEVKSTNSFIERFCDYKILCLGQEKAGTPLVSRRAVVLDYRHSMPRAARCARIFSFSVSGSAVHP
jgi:hypothetical protein